MSWLFIGLLACGASGPSEGGAPSDPGSSSGAGVLAAADAHDGAEDHVVSECAGCMLGMPGDASHAVEHEGYELHFCSATCKEGFEADPEAGVKRLESVVEPGS